MRLGDESAVVAVSDDVPVVVAEQVVVAAEKHFVLDVGLAVVAKRPS